MATPAINPTGSNFAPISMLASGMPGPGASTGTAIPTGGPGNYNFGNSTNPNPPGTGASTGAPSMYPGSGTPATTGQNPNVPGVTPGLNPASQGNLNKTLYGTFHTGFGEYLSSLLQSQGGYNSALTAQNVQDTIAAMQTNINRGSGTLNTQLAQQGVSPFSSVSALENAFYQSDAVTKENAIVAQDYFNMWSESMGREFDLAKSIEGPVAGEKASESTMAKLGGIGSFIGNILHGGSFSYTGGGGGGGDSGGGGSSGGGGGDSGGGGGDFTL